MSVLLPIQPGTLAPGVCYGSEQERLNAFAANMEAVLDGQSFFNFGPDVPSIANQSYPWFRTTDSRWYFFSGVWKSANPETSSYVRRLFVGSTTDLLTYDGGAAGVVTDTTGPMWEVDTNFEGRSPMAPGAISGANPAKTLAVGENYGEGAHTITVDELPAHSHPPAEGYDDFAGFVSVGEPSSYEITGGSEVNRMGDTGETGGGDAAPVIHPVRGCYIIKRTARLYYTI